MSERTYVTPGELRALIKATHGAQAARTYAGAGGTSSGNATDKRAYDRFMKGKGK